mgnify:FL=1
MSSDRPIRIDVGGVLASRLGDKARFVPRFLVRWLEKLICQDKLNQLLESNYPLRGAEFCDGVLCDLDVTIDIRNENLLPKNPRCIIVSNHPLGGLDGMSMISWLSRHYNRPVHFVVNDLLMAVEPLTDCFVPVNKHGRQSRSSLGSLEEALAGDGPVVIYPAGLCSRLGDDGVVADLAWNKMFVTKAIESRRDIVPVHFDGHNSPSFYRWARIRQRLGIKFNFEMLLLPREVFRSRGKTFTITCGTPVPWQSLEGGAKAASTAAQLRRQVYALPTNISVNEK